MLIMSDDVDLMYQIRDSNYFMDGIYDGRLFYSKIGDYTYIEMEGDIIGLHDKCMEHLDNLLNIANQQMYNQLQAMKKSTIEVDEYILFSYKEFIFIIQAPEGQTGKLSIDLANIFSLINQMLNPTYSSDSPILYS